MKNYSKRILSFMMAACLLIGLIPMSAGAEGVQASAEFVGQQLSLSDDLTMKFYVKLEGASAQDAVMQIAVADTQLAPESFDTTDAEGNYVFAVDLAAAQMTDDISLRVVVGGTAVAEKIYSVQEYAHELMEGNYTAETKQMVKEMLNYGAMAQTYFNYNANDLANKGYELESAATVPSATQDVAIDGAVDGISFYGASLLFESKVAIRYYFGATNGVDGYTFCVGDASYTAKEKDGYYYVDVPGINPQDLDKTVELTVTGADDAKLTVGYSPLLYIQRMYHKVNSSAELKNLLQAMYGYHLAAAAFTGVQEEETVPTTTVYYNNDFEGQTVIAGDKVYNIPDANGKNFTNNNDLFKTVVLEDGNTVLELISEGSATSFVSIADAPSVLKIKFRVRLAEETTAFSGRVLELRYRDGKKPFAVFCDSNLDMNTTTNNNNYYTRTALSTDWTDVEIIIDSVNGKIYYDVDGTMGEMAIVATTLTQIDFYSYSAHSGIYIDDLYVAAGVVTTSVAASVNWDDKHDDDGIRPAAVTLGLYNGETLVQTAQVSADNNWQHTFSDIPRFDNDNAEIAYTVKLDTVPEGYTLSQEQGVFTLHHTPESILYYNNDFEGQTVTAGDKVYNIPDANGRNFVNNNDLFKTVVLEDGNTVLELISEGSATSYLSIADAPSVLTIKFRARLAEESTTFSGRVLELRYRDGKKPFAAFADNSFDATISAKNGSHHLRTALSTDWTNVEMTIDAVAGKIFYNVNGNSGEMTVTAFTVTQLDFYSYGAHSGIYIDDLQIGQAEAKTTVNASVNWDDENDHDAIRPDTVELSLYCGETLLETAQVGADSDWKHSFTDLPKYDENNTLILYTVKLDAIPAGYNVSEAEGVFTLSHTPNVNWHYKNDFEGQTVTAGDKVYNIPDANGKNFVNNNDLFKTVVLEDGNTVLELISEGSATSFVSIADAPNALTIKFRARLAEETTSFSGRVLELRYRDGKKPFAAFGDNSFDATTSAKNESYYLRTALSTDWTDVEMTIDAKNGKITYSVNCEIGEMAVTPFVWSQLDFYSHSAHSGIYIDDLCIGDKESTIDVDASVVWDDGDDQDNIRPDSVNLGVYNGDALIEEVMVTADANWQHTFVGLDKYDADGKKMSYTVKLLAVPMQYTVSIADNVVTLSHTPVAEFFYDNSFEGQMVEAGDGLNDIKDSEGRIFTENKDSYQTHTENGNTYLEACSTATAASQALVWTNTTDTLPEMLVITMKMKVAEDASFGKDQITLRYRRGDKNYVFAKLYDKQLVIDGVSSTLPSLTEWTEIGFIINSVTGECTYRIGTVEGSFAITADTAGFQGFMIRCEPNNSGLYLDDLQVKTGVQDVTASVKWEDAHNYDGVRPDSVIIKLYSGETLLDTFEANASNNWQKRYINMPLLDADGAMIDYSAVLDEAPEGYTAATNNTTVTLSHTVELPNTNKPDGKVTAFFYNDYEGEKNDFDIGATVTQNDQSMKTVTGSENSYMRVGITDPLAIATYQADFVNNREVDHFVVHFKLSTENTAPDGTFLAYRYNTSESQKLFEIVDYSRLGGILKYDGTLSIGGEVYNQYLIEKNQWLEMDLVFDLTSADKDTCVFYIGGTKVTTLELPKHDADYLISYMRFNFLGKTDNLGETLLVDDFMIYEGNEILTIAEVNSPGYMYWVKPHAIDDVAMELPEQTEPNLTQSVIDQAVQSADIPWPQTDGHNYPATQSANALYYMVLAAHLDPNATATDGTVVANEAAARIKNLVSGGREPWASVGCYWGHGVVSSALLLAKNTPAIWNQMSEDDTARIDLLMECLAIAANWGYNSENDYLTGVALEGNFGKNYNPNFKNAYFTCYMSAAMYFGAEELDNIYIAFDYNSYITRLTDAGFTNILYAWTMKDSSGVSVGHYMQYGGTLTLPNGQAAGSGVGVAVPFTYKDLQNGYIYDSSELIGMFIDTVGFTYSWEVTSSNQAPDSDYYSYILSGAKSPWEGQMGMMREFASGERSKVDYSYFSAMNIAPLYANMKLLGYWNYSEQSAEIAQKMLQMDNRIYVGTEDLFFKMQEGYLGHSQNTAFAEYEWHFNQHLGASYVKDIFMNFHFMKNEEIVMQSDS